MAGDALISVVIPTYNYGRFVEQAVDTTLAQTGVTVEVIVVDDGSTDDTSQRLQRYGERIQLVSQPNRGLCAARNTGIRRARGQWIALLDSDDVWRPTKLATQLDLLSRHAAAGLVSTGAFTLDATGIESAPPAADATEFVEYRLPDLLEFSPFCPSSVLLTRQCLDTIGLFDETLSGSGDLDMWLRVAAKFQVLHLTKPLTGYRLHPESMSNKADLMFNDHRRVLAKAEIPDRRLRRIAEARMYREAAWMRYAAGHRFAAIRDVARSIFLWPGALHNHRRQKLRWARAKALARYALRAPSQK